MPDTRHKFKPTTLSPGPQFTAQWNAYIKGLTNAELLALLYEANQKRYNIVQLAIDKGVER